MANSRRGFLTGAAAVIGTMPLARPATGQKSAVSSDTILALFKSLPGDVALKILLGQ
jgi:beta-lactamase class A